MKAIARFILVFLCLAISGPVLCFEHKFVALVAHGLNNPPSVMDQLSEVLKEDGAEVYHVCADFGAMEDVTGKKWEDDFLTSYFQARKRADVLKVPLYFIGYSLGALVSSKLLSEGKIKYDKEVLLAPAININLLANLVRFLNIFGDNFCLDSRNEEKYRANPCTTVSAYNALFSLLNDFRNNQYHNMNIPTLLVGDYDDELVDVAGIQKDIKKFGLNYWFFFPIDKRDASETKYHHLIFNKEVLGPNTWKMLVENIHSFLFYKEKHPKIKHSVIVK